MEKERKRRRGSFRNRLMACVFLLCLALIALVYFLSVYLLEPMYNRRIRQEAEATLQTLVQTLDTAEYPAVQYDLFGQPHATDRLKEELGRQVYAGQLHVTGRCIEISDQRGLVMWRNEALSGTCLLHAAELSYGSGGTLYGSELAGQLRAQVRADGQVSRFLVNQASDSRQLVRGAQSQSGLVVLVSADFERIPQAVEVLTGQMKWVSLALLGVSLCAAWVFSTLFTRRLSGLSDAAREVARGNYEVRVDEHGSDEMAVLAADFNRMTAEVGRSAQLQRDLLANISHDLRTPLTLIKGYAETVRDLTGDDAARRTEQLNVIVEESDRLGALVNSVLELSRMSSGAEKPNPVPFDMAQLCEEVAARYGDICAKNGCTLQLETDGECPVTADAAMMERVLHNLLGNALTHAGADGWLGLRCRRTEAGAVRVEVADHGSGIPPEELPHLFDKYYRARASRGKQGTGLGLSITRAILQEHGFRFGVQSEVGAGSTFWFETAEEK